MLRRSDLPSGSHHDDHGHLHPHPSSIDVQLQTRSAALSASECFGFASGILQLMTEGWLLSLPLLACRRWAERGFPGHPVTGAGLGLADWHSACPALRNAFGRHE